MAPGPGPPQLASQVRMPSPPAAQPGLAPPTCLPHPHIPPSCMPGQPALGRTHLSRPLSRAKPHRAAEHRLRRAGSGGCGRAHLYATATQEEQHVRPPHPTPSPGAYLRGQALGPWGTRGTAMPAHTRSLAGPCGLRSPEESAPGQRREGTGPPPLRPKTSLPGERSKLPRLSNPAVRSPNP